ncbi:MAG TPA: low temperature requirement protein A [Acidimicrobiales bacterium]|nr:low temperature requirement protein A [Acidimicrobiales bacterium]
MTGGIRGALRQWLWSPPRGHGEVSSDRTVSALELFYDLVYVAVISRAAHHLAEHVTARGFLEFTVVFGLIWAAWINGSLYLELHGREDGRTRNTVFLQMGILVLLAVFTTDAAGHDGTAFALVYALFLAVMAWLWYSVRRQDLVEHPEFLAPAARYVAGMAIGAVVIAASAAFPAGPRLAVWAVFGLAWLGGMVAIGHSAVIDNQGLPPTDSLVERFGLFTIIVLGEVIVGVVNGLSIPDRDLTTVATGMIALAVGFGFWWNYFDLVGRRMPRGDGGSLITWMLSHLPITLSISAAGAAMVSLIGHASDARTPVSTAWLLAGSVALGLVALMFAEQALVDADRLAVVYRPLRIATAVAAAMAVVVGWARPAPWLLALLLVVVLSVLWTYAVSCFLRAGAWGPEQVT